MCRVEKWPQYIERSPDAQRLPDWCNSLHCWMISARISTADVSAQVKVQTACNALCEVASVLWIASQTWGSLLLENPVLQSENINQHICSPSWSNKLKFLQWWETILDCAHTSSTALCLWRHTDLSWGLENAWHSGRKAVGWLVQYLGAYINPMPASSTHLATDCGPMSTTTPISCTRQCWLLAWCNPLRQAARGVLCSNCLSFCHNVKLACLQSDPAQGYAVMAEWGLCTSRTSALPHMLDTDLLPCLATFAPAAAARTHAPAREQLAQSLL